MPVFWKKGGKRTVQAKEDQIKVVCLDTRGTK